MHFRIKFLLFDLQELEGIDKCRYCKLALESMCTFKNELIIKMAVNIAATLGE